MIWSKVSEESLKKREKQFFDGGLSLQIRKQTIMNRVFIFLNLCFFISCSTISERPTLLHQDSKITELGHSLFFEKKLSINQTKSCATCHDPQFAFTDGYRRSLGVYADRVLHNAPSCLNLTTYQSFNWDSPSIKTIFQQSAKPLFTKHPAEMGMTANDSVLFSMFANDDLYKPLFKKTFPMDKNPYTWANIRKALAAYTEKLVARNSQYDKWLNGDSTALSASAKRGYDLFFSKKMACGDCHGGKDLSLTKVDTTNFHNIGLYEKYPDKDAGVHGRGRFRTPTLRNIAITAPYMHDGSVATLGELIRIFERGGRMVNYGSNKGDGALNPYKSPRIKGFTLSDTERQDVFNFLFSLTDTSYLKKPFYLAPK
jgi:cytochrome c peroxidase